MGGTMRPNDRKIPDWEDLPKQEPRIRERDWDVLIVFDACRFGAMETLLRKERPDADVEPVSTPARKSTPDWTATVWDGDWSDVTYYAGNPFSEYVSDMEQFDYFDLGEHVGEFVKGWETSAHSEDHGLVTADGLTKLILEERKDPPLVIHYLQPHPPFAGAFTMQFKRGDSLFTNILPSADDGGPKTRPSRFVYNDMMDEELLRALYMENLATAWRHAESVVKHYSDANIVLTSDHGEALGREGWDHGPPEANVKRTIPWVEL